MKFKVHHILLLVFSFFIVGMLISSVLKMISKDKQKIKSEMNSAELLAKVEPEALLFLKKINPNLDINYITQANLFFFKNKRDIVVHLVDSSQNYILKLDFINLSPGFGLREKLGQLTPAEGQYSILYSGYTKLSGLFVRLDYPPESFKEYQKMDFELLKEDPYLISEKAISYSFIQAEKDFINFFVYLSLKLNSENIKVLIYPDIPPLTMELGGTEFVSEVYLGLETEYNKLKIIMDAQSDEGAK